MEVLIKGLEYAVTQDDERRVLRGASILIKDGVIEDVGDVKGPVDEVIDGSGMVAIPGLINTHSHIPMTLLRGVADDMDLFPWLQEKIWPMESHLRPDHIRAGTALGVLEAVRTGTTTIFDMYFFEDVVAEVLSDLGMRGVLSEAIIDFGTPECKDVDECMALADQFIRKWRDHPLIEPGYGPHAPYTVSPERMREISEKAEENGSTIQIHLAETEREVSDIKEKYGKGAIELAHESGILGDRTVAAHVVWPSQREIALLRETSTLVSHNPVSNLKLASGISPVPDLVEKGVRVSLGTDGPASNNTLDMFETMKVTALIHKVSRKDPKAIPAQMALDMATRIPGDFLRWRIGRICKGYRGDIVLLNVKVPWWVPLHSVVSHLVYSARSTDVEYVLIEGEVILKNGKFTKRDEEDIFAEAERASLDLLEKSGVKSLLKGVE